MILGIDEVGRGAWAGPLVVGAVVLGESPIVGLADSKVLNKKQRQALVPQIKQSAKDWALGWVSANRLDEIGLAAALDLATLRAARQIKTTYNQIIIDGTVNFLRHSKKAKYVTTLKQADKLIPAVSAAAILAKVARDDFMSQQAKKYPDYGFEKHVGYGTLWHRQAIERLGATELHRLSFAPLKKYQNSAGDLKAQTQNCSTSLGARAERIVADFLLNQGHQILAQNWKTKLCEIDIVSMRAGQLFFTEVKYRRSNLQGGAIEAITPAKLRQMHFAAEVFCQQHKLNNIDAIQLAFGLVEGSDFKLKEWTKIN